MHHFFQKSTPFAPLPKNKGKVEAYEKTIKKTEKKKD
jgi:hypothetical protein